MTDELRQALLMQADRQENLYCNAAVAHESAQMMRKAAAALAQPAREPMTDERQNALRYLAFFDAGLPITYLGVEYRNQAELDAAIDAHITTQQGEGGAST